MSDGGMFAKDQLRLSLFLLCEVTRRAERKPGDPVTTANCGVSLQVEEVDILAHGEMIDATAFFHD